MPSPNIADSLNRFRTWTGKHAPPQRTRLDGTAGATPAAIKSLEKALGASLPASFVGYLKISNGGLNVFEYDGVSIEDVIEHHLGSKASGKKTFKQLRWVPFASDGGGNKWVLDVSTKPDLVRRWELAGGNHTDEGVDFATFVGNLVTALETGEHKYDASSMMFDGPFIDLLAKPAKAKPTKAKSAKAKPTKAKPAKKKPAKPAKRGK